MNPLDLLVALLRSFLLRQCSVCHRPNVPTNPDAAGWIHQFRDSILIGAKCPNCQTPLERAECVVEQAVGPKFHYEGLRVVKNPEPTDGDDDPQAKAS
jgi:hypothetical protein